MKKAPNVVYKYTTYETFKLIIGSKTLRMTDIQKSNDSTELKLIHNILSQVFEEEFSKELPNYMKTFFPLNAFQEFYNKNTEHIIRNENKLHTQFVTCFSSDGDMLSQWRGYGDDGKGVAIGFDVQEIPISSEYQFNKVQYSLRSQKALVRKEVSNLIKKLRLEVKTNKKIDEKFRINFQIEFNELICKYGAFIKNHFFREEKEWRYCHWDNRSRAYQNFDFNAEIIKEVVIGPKCNVSEKEIKEFLSNNKIRCNVWHSRGHGVYIESENQKSK